MVELIVFVDENDSVVGSGTKEQALLNQAIHRIVRVVVHDRFGTVLLQRRASTLISLPNRWDQSASGHVRLGETYIAAATRELREELGLIDVPLEVIGKYYSEEADEPSIKRRFNMVFAAKHSGPVPFDGREVDDVRWVTMDQLEHWLRESPQDFTEGARICFTKFFLDKGAGAARS